LFFNTQIFRITSGNFTVENPGQAAISFTGNFFSFPQTTSYKIAQAVGASFDGIDCDAKTKITFTVGGLDFEVKFDFWIELKMCCYTVS
jgi:hypothetical protein